MSVVIHAVTLGSMTDIQLGIELIKDSRIMIAPRTRDRTEEIPGRDGEWDYGSDYRVREFRLRFAFVDCTNETEVQTAMRLLAGHLIDPYGKPKNFELSFVSESGVYYTVRQSQAIEIKRGKPFQWEFELRLLAMDPFGHGAETVTLGSLTTSPDTLAVTNSGNAPSSPVIVLTNSGAATIHGFTLSREV